MIYIVSACSSVKTEVDVTPTITNLPTVTYTSPPSITPLPTIPTFTPTFDVSTIVTVTHQSKSTCNDTQLQEIINSLVPSSIIPLKTTLIDISNDGFPDLIIENSIYETNQGNWLQISAYICVNNEYVKFNFAGSQSPLRIPYLVNIEDLNKNGIPEIVVVEDDCWGMGQCEIPKIFEWDNSDFINLAYKPEYLVSWGDLSLSFEDIDKNGTIEILYHEGPYQSGDTRFNGSFRPYTEIYSWDGETFTPMFTEMSQPVFRFQAIDDADQMTLINKYDKALFLYKDAINNKNLLSYSFELSFYYRSEFTETYDLKSIPTPSHSYPEYPGEFQSLASYAYYRIMLIQLVQGQETEAQATYQTLQDTFGNDALCQTLY